MESSQKIQSVASSTWGRCHARTSSSSSMWWTTPSCTSAIGKNLTRHGRKRLVAAMNNKVHDLTTYSFSKDETLLLDANVWLYLFPPPSETRTAPAGYSAALKPMLTVGVLLALDS